ncbi:MAG TPA: NGG1p interacting factor NIF3 [Spirochaetota bacterium]|nr:NGG1p interacting factor NIF3 [Spirochaetota bacterium]HPP04032.1 NGG1p interacting factor NIF3 [Spirochaetota bacterium]
MYYITFFVPESHLETVKNALFEAGAGRYKNYDYCSFEVKGRGQFRPLEGSNPFLGKKNEIEKVDEYRVEMLCEKRYLKKVLKKLLEVHPYEEPAYFVVKIKTIRDIF